jgi:hypothetical protein
VLDFQATDHGMTDQPQDKRRSNIILAIVLGLVAAAFYVGFIVINSGGGQ